MLIKNAAKLIKRYDIKYLFLINELKFIKKSATQPNTLFIKDRLIISPNNMYDKGNDNFKLMDFIPKTNIKVRIFI